MKRMKMYATAMIAVYVIVFTALNSLDAVASPSLAEKHIQYIVREAKRKHAQYLEDERAGLNQLYLSEKERDRKEQVMALMKKLHVTECYFLDEGCLNALKRLEENKEVINAFEQLRKNDIQIIFTETSDLERIFITPFLSIFFGYKATPDEIALFLGLSPQ